MSGAEKRFGKGKDPRKAIPAPVQEEAEENASDQAEPPRAKKGPTIQDRISANGAESIAASLKYLLSDKK